MGFKARIVKEDEWPALQAKGALPATMPMPGALVLILEDEATGEVVGRWMAVVALEGLFIDEEKRGNPAVARRLYGTMLRTLQELGVGEVLTLIQTPYVEELAEKAGFRPLAGRLWRREL